MNTWRRVLLAAALVATPLLRAELPAVVRTLYLVRHGMYDPVKGDDEKTSNPLNALGREQAAFAAARLAALPVKFNLIVSSELLRARETGDIVAAKLGAVCQRDALLNETTPPGVDLTALKATPDAGAESQLAAAWTRYAQPTSGAPRSELLVCHGNVIRWFVCKALGADQARWTRMRIANGSLTLIAIRADGSTSLLMFNDTSHVPLDKQTWSMTNAPLWPTPAARPAK
jgi:serine/threonine-protein phosphatase PGAM5